MEGLNFEKINKNVELIFDGLTNITPSNINEKVGEMSFNVEILCKSLVLDVASKLEPDELIKFHSDLVEITRLAQLTGMLNSLDEIVNGEVNVDDVGGQGVTN